MKPRARAPKSCRAFYAASTSAAWSWGGGGGVVGAGWLAVRRTRRARRKREEEEETPSATSKHSESNPALVPTASRTPPRVTCVCNVRCVCVECRGVAVVLARKFVIEVFPPGLLVLASPSSPASLPSRDHMHHHAQHSTPVLSTRPLPLNCSLSFPSPSRNRHVACCGKGWGPQEEEESPPHIDAPAAARRTMAPALAPDVPSSSCCSWSSWPCSQ